MYYLAPASHDASVRLIQERIDSNEWWIIISFYYDSALLACAIESQYYEEEPDLLDVAVFPQPTETIPFVCFTLAAKSCHPAKELARFLEAEPAEGQNVLIPASTPDAVVQWLVSTFRIGKEGRVRLR